MIEILLVISIIGLMVGVSVPASIEMYRNYKSSLKAEEVLGYVANVRRESFLYGEETVLSTVEGRIRHADGRSMSSADLYVQSDAPIRFYKNGTTSGGVLRIRAGESLYRLKIAAPFGDLLLERDT